VKVIESGLTNRNATRVCGEGFQSIDEIVWRVGNVTRVNADAGEDFWMKACDFEIGRAVVKAGSKRDHAVDVVLLCVCDDVRDVFGLKFVRAEVAMGIYDHSVAVKFLKGG